MAEDRNRIDEPIFRILEQLRAGFGRLEARIDRSVERLTGEVGAGERRLAGATMLMRSAARVADERLRAVDPRPAWPEAAR